MRCWDGTSQIVLRLDTYFDVDLKLMCCQALSSLVYLDEQVFSEGSHAVWDMGSS